MDDIAFSDWPGSPVDLSGSNPWLPAYGYQPPQSLLDKDDFLGNPDGALFLQTGCLDQQQPHYIFLETIVEETSDDLRSESSGRSRNSPVGWLATDSESGSVIRVCDSDSDGEESACPAKRRREEPPPVNQLMVDSPPLSRSSSLLQFESLEKHCQEYSSSPSILSLFSHDSLERRDVAERRVSPDSLERSDTDSDSLLYQHSTLRRRRASASDCSDDTNSGDSSRDSDETLLLASSCVRQCSSLETLSRPTVVRDKMSAENLSEDSGYSGDLHSTLGIKPPPPPRRTPSKLNGKGAFSAYDGGECPIFQNVASCFGTSCQDLTNFERYSNRVTTNFVNPEASVDMGGLLGGGMVPNIALECFAPSSKYNTTTSASEPDLHRIDAVDPPSSVEHRRCIDTNRVSCRQGFFGETVCVSSVPNLTCDLQTPSTTCVEPLVSSIAAKNWDLCTIKSPAPAVPKTMATATFRREDSYLSAIEAENSINTTLNATSESSIRSLCSSDSDNITRDVSLTDGFYHSTPITRRTVASTPNLSTTNGGGVYQSLLDEPLDTFLHSSTHSVPRKSSLMDKSGDDTIKKASSSSGSAKGVHFCPVVSEVSWNESSPSTTDEEQEEDEESGEEEGSGDEEDDDASSVSVGSEGSDVSEPPTNECNQEEVETRGVNVNKTEVSSVLAVHGGPLHAPRQPPPPPPVRDHVTVLHSSAPSLRLEPELSEQKAAPTGKEAVGAMEPAAADGHTRQSRSAKLGSFLSRFASFRFSGKKDKKKQQKNGQQPNNIEKKSTVHNQPNQKDNKTVDYIYIPLKGPLPSSTPVENVVTSKPPLPRAPPPQRSASARATTGGGTERRRVERDGRATIDQVGGGSVAGTVTTSDRRSGTVRNACSMEPMGLIETDLDTQVTVITAGTAAHVKTRSLMNLGPAPQPLQGIAVPPQQDQRPHKSMEFLLDKENLKTVQPPENELQKVGVERVMSEHQLRVQRSLQKLHIPDWYKQNQVPREGFLLGQKHTGRESRWHSSGTHNATGHDSKTPSLSSLGSGQSPVLLSPAPFGQPFTRWSTSRLNSAASSPCASTRASFNHHHHGYTNYQQQYNRVSGGGLANGQGPPLASPCSTRSSFSYRQPYLGWRSQERLSRPRTPAERLATTISLPPTQPASDNPEVQSSIKEVTSAIVHYVSALNPPSGSSPRSERKGTPSPRGSNQRLCWLESSFVGTRPLESPETPVSLPNDTQTRPTMRLDLPRDNDVTSSLYIMEANRPSPSSTTLEDVLDSLLGLPPSTRAPSPSLQEHGESVISVIISANASPCNGPSDRRNSNDTESDVNLQQYRRRSEGSETAAREQQRKNLGHHQRQPNGQPPQPPQRRVSFHTTNSVVPHSAASSTTSSIAGGDTIKCRYNKCGRISTKASDAGKKYKNCHNCTYIYCSRECRRSHWEKHRKLCLFSRVGALCRQVLAAAKEHKEALRQLSLTARRGYLAHGVGTVKIFFSSPECAEKFINDGHSDQLPEPVYVGWADLQPSEMGPNLYSDLVKMCKTYNPDTRFVLYVSVCVVSEVPATGAVKWERQLVSRCAKIRLCKSVLEQVQITPPTQVGTQNPIPNHRQASFAAVQKQLKQRGVSLRKQFPDVYHKLCSYVDGKTDKFSPVTIYPKDITTGKSFMCVIMPDVVEPEKLKLKLPSDNPRTNATPPPNSSK